MVCNRLEFEGGVGSTFRSRYRIYAHLRELLQPGFPELLRGRFSERLFVSPSAAVRGLISVAD
eukprot:7263384-Pyramimonas_sp.AAC.2